MIAIIQRCSQAGVDVDGRTVAEFDGLGLLALVGIVDSDAEADLEFIAQKLPTLRIFPDEQGKMNRSVLDVAGAILLVPNFTLAGDAARGRRPSFDRAMRPERAEPLFNALLDRLRSSCPRTFAGVFRAHMRVRLVNDGPVTILLDSADRP